MLEIKNVYKTFNPGTVNQKVALNDLNLTLEDGDFVTVIGGNGAGKSTTLNAVAGVWPVDSGQILIDGVDVTGLPEHKRAKYLGRVFQDPMTGTVADMEILENLALAARRGKKRGLSWGVKKSEKEEYRTLLKQFELGLEDRMTSKVGLLSGGQRQRICIARTLVVDPKLVVCDEPVSALDVSIQAQIINLLEQIQAEMGISYIFIAHDLAVVKHISDRILVMYLGRVMEIAPCEELYEHSLHPYTQALLSAIPVADPEIEENREVTTVQGEVPSILKRPSGCPFHNRCPQCTERCKQETPQLHEAFPGHFVACHLYGQE